MGLHHEILDAQHMAREAYKHDINGPRIQKGLQEAMLQAGLKAK